MYQTLRLLYMLICVDCNIHACDATINFCGLHLKLVASFYNDSNRDVAVAATSGFVIRVLHVAADRPVLSSMQEWYFFRLLGTCRGTETLCALYTAGAR